MAKKSDVPASAEIIAKFDTYEAAVEHVEKLLSGNFPVRQIAIVGRGIRTVERTRARISYARMAITGAFNGALLGLIWHGLTGDTTNPASYTSTVITFAGMGIIANIVRLVLSRNKRTFSSQNQLVADTYEIQIPRDLKAAAEDALSAIAKKAN